MFALDSDWFVDLGEIHVHDEDIDLEEMEIDLPQEDADDAPVDDSMEESGEQGASPFADLPDPFEIPDEGAGQY